MRTARRCPQRSLFRWLFSLAFAAALLGCSARQPPDLAQRLGSSDPALRAAASQELDAMGRRERVAFLRAGLKGTGPGAIACAKRLTQLELDVAEWARVAERLLAGLRAGDTEVDFNDLRYLLGSCELGAVLADFPPAASRPEQWTRGQMLSHLHRQVRAEHVPALCRLAIGPELELRGSAFENLSVAIEYTDQHRETVARTLLALQPDAARVVEKTNPYGLAAPHPVAIARAKDGWPDLLCRTLQLVFGGSFPRGLPTQWPAWTARWALAVPPAAEDLPLLASLLRGDDQGCRVAALRGLEHIPGDEAAALLQAAAASEDLAPLALGVLARRGDRAAATDLETRADQNVDALLLLLWAAPTRGREVLAAQLLGPDAERASRILTQCEHYPLELSDQVTAGFGVTWDDAVFDGLAGAAASSGVDAARLARLYAALPACRAPALRVAAITGLQHAIPQDADAAERLKPFCCLLEVEDPQAVRRLLRAWLRPADPGVVEVAAGWLLDLGDPASAPDLIRWVARRDAKEVGGLLPRLARSACPEVEAFLRQRALAPEGSAGDALAAYTALGVLHGLPPRLAESLASVELEEPDLRRIRALLLDGKPIDALLLAAAPAPAGKGAAVTLVGMGEVRDPRVRSLLLEFRDRRELGRHTAAICELAIQGDPSARAQMWRGCEEGRYMWIEDAGPDALTLGRDLTTIPFWISEMESNCCRFVPVAFIFRNLFGIEVNGIGPYSARTRADVARHFWARYGPRMRWSQLASGPVCPGGHFIVQ